MPNYMITSIVLLIIIYPFIIYFQLKSFSSSLKKHWENIEELLLKYKENNSETNLEKLHTERRTYNTLVRANDNKLNSMLGKFIANKYNFEQREEFKFKG